MFGNHHVGDVENVKDHHNGTGISGLGTKGTGASMRVAPIVRTGHPALDAALATDRSAKPDLRTLQAGCRRGTDAMPRALGNGPSVTVGVVSDALSLTPDRDGAGSTLHAGSTHAVVDARGRSRTIRVWHELATHGCN